MSIKTLRIIGILEGISFLILLFFAMPLKYIWNNPIWVKYVGMGHGFLFIAFILVLFFVYQRLRWPHHMLSLGLIASVLPFGPFIYDQKLKKHEAQELNS